MVWDPGGLASLPVPAVAHRHLGCPILDLRGPSPGLVRVRRRAQSPLHVQQWRQALVGYEDRELITALEWGFPTLSACAPQSVLAANHGSVGDNIPATSADVEAEVRVGRLLAFTSPPFWPLRVSPLGSIPKPHSTKRRRISDLSFPRGRSVNCGIDLSLLAPQHYTTVDDAVARIVELKRQHPGARVFAAKIDVEAAYRQIPVREADWWHQVYVWEGKFLVDTRLPFGLRSAPHHFTRITKAIVFIMRRRGAVVLGYLDDFLMLEVGQDRCEAVVALMVKLFREVGLPVQAAKLAVEGVPTEVITFLGIELDSVAMKMRLPAERLARVRAVLASWDPKSTATVRELQSLIGHLVSAARVVRPGRIYVGRLLALLRKAHGTARTRVSLDAAARADVDWWRMFLLRWNGVALIPPEVPLSDQAAQFWTDASGWGFGGFFRGHYFYGPWAQDELVHNINTRELVGLVFAVCAFGPGMRGLSIMARCDNLVTVQAVNHQRASCPVLLSLLRRLHLVCAHYDITLRTCHVAGVDNTLADALSRNQLPLFHRLTASSPVPLRHCVLSPQTREWRSELSSVTCAAAWPLPPSWPMRRDSARGPESVTRTGGQC